MANGTRCSHSYILLIPRACSLRVFACLSGYAYDAGMRVGDKLLKIDDFDIKPTTAVDEVRNHLRGEPGTPVSITFARESVGGGGGDGKKSNEPQTITLQRSVVRIPDVKYFGEFVRCMRFAMAYLTRHAREYFWTSSVEMLHFTFKLSVMTVTSTQVAELCFLLCLLVRRQDLSEIRMTASVTSTSVASRTMRDERCATPLKHCNMARQRSRPVMTPPETGWAWWLQIQPS